MKRLGFKKVSRCVVGRDKYKRRERLYLDSWMGFNRMENLFQNIDKASCWESIRFIKHLKINCEKKQDYDTIGGIKINCTGWKF